VICSHFPLALDFFLPFPFNFSFDISLPLHFNTSLLDCSLLLLHFGMGVRILGVRSPCLVWSVLEEPGSLWKKRIYMGWLMILALLVNSLMIQRVFVEVVVVRNIIPGVISCSPSPMRMLVPMMGRGMQDFQFEEGLVSVHLSRDQGSH
jgi:hypothetical protein